MFPSLRQRLVRGLVVLLFAPLPAGAHEYWIAPEDFTPAPGDTVEARLLVGQMMQGTELPWLSHQVASMEVAAAGAATAIEGMEGMEGDLPAIRFRAEEPSLHVIAHTTHRCQATPTFTS